MVNVSSGVTIMRKNIGTWNEILIVFWIVVISSNKVSMHLSKLKNALVILTYDVWSNRIGKNLVAIST